MGTIRQKKKNRSGLPKARPKNSGVIKSGRKKINVLGNSIIAENWYVAPPMKMKMDRWMMDGRMEAKLSN